MRQEAIYLFVTAGLIIIFALIVVAGFCCKVLSNRNRHILVAILLMLVFAVAVVLILRYVNNANLNDTPVNWYTHFNYKTNNWRGSHHSIQITSATSTHITSWSSPLGSLPLPSLSSCWVFSALPWAMSPETIS